MGPAVVAGGISDGRMGATTNRGQSSGTDLMMDRREEAAMPVEFGIWRIDEGVIPVPSSSLDNEAKLEDILEEDLSILGLDVLLLIGRQVVTALGKRVDLLAMDVNGDLYAIELKRGRTPREVVAQTIDYGYWLRDLETEGVLEVFEKHNHTSFDQSFHDRFDQAPPEDLNENHQLIIVASELDASTERIVSYVSDYGVPVNVVFFQHFRDGDREYLGRSWLIDPVEVEVGPARSKPGGPRKQRPPWNGQDFYVSFGESEEYDQRRWEDALRYGFISAGGGLWFSRTLEQLFPGARVFVCIPKTGYVGVGIVKETSQRVSDFKVEVDGVATPILEAPLQATAMGKGADDADKSEYVVRVDWIKALDRDDAIWEKGMFANQNSAAKFRNQFTLERLIELFGLDQDELA
jgi:hypothetical protein